MLNLSNVLQLVIHCLYYSPLPEKQLVGYGHQCSLHVALQFRYKLYAIHKEPFEKTLANVPFVANELSMYEFHKRLIFKRFPIIHITRCYHKVKQFSRLIAYQVKLEPKEPAHGAFASLCDALECLVHMNPLILAYTQRGVLSTKLMPVHLPKRTFLTNTINGMAISRSSSTKRLTIVFLCRDSA